MKRIILIGFMGSGKSTLGKKIAKKMDLPFIDSDREIEKRHQKTIGDIFTENGESFFRTLETEYITSLKDKEEFVLATGGGMPCFGKNMELLNELGTTFYLDRSPKELANRLYNAKTRRPLIDGMEQEELVSFIEERLSARDEYYKTADVILDRDDQSVSVIEDLTNLLHPHLQKS
ncbi:MAG: shikimate kinase [Crocinitomicaceae bacterium]|nr:shikimate kinase [Flavobacteriales bacterium]NQZ36934.1 shikimate kinase [Crocinitomicaceae bacterium]